MGTRTDAGGGSRATSTAALAHSRTPRTRWSRIRLGRPVAALALILVGMLAADAALGATPARVVRRGPEKARVVALTIDDGWHAGRCERMANTLLRHGVPATWFPNAAYMGRSPEVWRRIGQHFEMANHTTHHRSLPTLSESEMRREILSNERRVETITGRPMSKILRPPYGAYDGRVLRVAGELGYATVALWDVSAADTSSRATEASVARAGSRGGKGSIVLMHCGPESTPRALPIIIARYACAGFRFATLGELLTGSKGVTAEVECPPPRPTGEGGGGRGGPGRSAGTGSRAQLAAHEWQLVEAASEGGLEPVAPDARLTLRFGRRTASGEVGCDPYSVPLKRERDGSLSFGRVVRAREGCPEALGDIEGRLDGYLEMLLTSASQRLADGSLVLLDDEGRERLRFRPGDRNGLIGDWTITAIHDGQSEPLLPAAEQAPTVTFEPTGTLRGTTSCNPYVAGFSARGQALTAGPLLTAPGACDQEQTHVEERFLAAMRAAASWQLRDGVLEIRDPEEDLILELVPRGSRSGPAGEPTAAPSLAATY